MTAHRPLLAHHFALLHLIGVLSLCKTDGDPAQDDDAVNELDGGMPPRLQIPQELMLNALCYLTEQIHEVAPPHIRLSQLVHDIGRLSFSSSPSVSANEQQQNPAATPSVTRRPSARKGTSAAGLSGSKRVSLSPTATTRSLRHTRSSNPVAGPSTPVPAAASGSASADRRASTSSSSITASTPTPPPHIARGGLPRVHEEPSTPSKKLAAALDKAIKGDVVAIRENGYEELMNAMGEFRTLLGDLDDPRTTAFLDSASPLGRWIRRCMLSFNTSSYEQIETLLSDIIVFGSSGPILSDEEDALPRLASLPSNSSHAQSEGLPSRASVYERYLAALHRNDYSASLSLLSEFFDFDAGPFYGGSGSNRGMRQHALLHLADFHASHGEYGAARTAVEEGLKLARQAGDLTVLNALTSLLRRISHEDTSLNSDAGLDNPDGGAGGSSAYDAAREDPGGYVPPVDQLWDVRYGMGARVPLPSLLNNLYRAKALHHYSLTARTSLSAKERKKEKKLAVQRGQEAAVPVLESQQRKLKWNRMDAIAWLQMSAGLWEGLGSTTIGQAYREIGAILSDPRSRWSNPSTVDIEVSAGNRIAIVADKADQLARRGSYDTALALVLAEAMPGGAFMTLRDVTTWQCAVYSVLTIQAERLGFEAVLRHIEASRPPVTLASGFPARPTSAATRDPDGALPSEAAGPDYESLQQSGLIGEVESLLIRSSKLLDASLAAQALPMALKAFQLSSVSDGQGLLALHRSAALQLARVQAAFKAPDRAIRLLDTVWADILSSSDSGLLAQAKIIRADCLGALLDQLDEEDKYTIDEADRRDAQSEMVELLREAHDGFSGIQNAREALSALERLAKALHAQGLTQERDMAAKTWREAHNALLDNGEREAFFLVKLAKVERLLALVCARVAADLSV